MDARTGKSKNRMGVPGLDDILLGGLAVGRVFLLEGSPGTGKTHHGDALPARRGPGPAKRGLYIHAVGD